MYRTNNKLTKSTGVYNLKDLYKINHIFLQKQYDGLNPDYLKSGLGLIFQDVMIYYGATLKWKIKYCYCSLCLIWQY